MGFLTNKIVKLVKWLQWHIILVLVLVVRFTQQPSEDHPPTPSARQEGSIGNRFWHADSTWIWWRSTLQHTNHALNRILTISLQMHSFCWRVCNEGLTANLTRFLLHHACVIRMTQCDLYIYAAELIHVPFAVKFQNTHWAWSPLVLLKPWYTNSRKQTEINCRLCPLIY